MLNKENEDMRRGKKKKEWHTTHPPLPPSIYLTLKTVSNCTCAH